MPYDIELYKERSITPDGFSSSDALDGLFSDSEQTKSDKKVLQEKESLLNTLSKLAIYLYEIQHIDDNNTKHKEKNQYFILVDDYCRLHQEIDNLPGSIAHLDIDNPAVFVKEKYKERLWNIRDKILDFHCKNYCSTKIPNMSLEYPKDPRFREGYKTTIWLKEKYFKFKLINSDLVNHRNRAYEAERKLVNIERKYKKSKERSMELVSKINAVSFKNLWLSKEIENCKTELQLLKRNYFENTDRDKLNDNKKRKLVAEVSPTKRLVLPVRDPRNLITQDLSSSEDK